MPTTERQTLARYAFFEQARRLSSHSEDALVPLILPAIAGKAGTVFSGPELGRALAPLFGSDLVNNLADSMVEPLLRQGYLKREALIADGSVYTYTNKVNELRISDADSEAERNLSSIMLALSDYINATRVINPLNESPANIRESFVNWITTMEALDFVELQDNGARTLPDIAIAAPDDGTVAEMSSQARLLFASFVSWLSRERPAIFAKVALLAELGLVIDLVSEIRVPTRKGKKVSLTVVLDTRILLELLGMYGNKSKESVERLLIMCKSYGIIPVTLVHLVEEVKEIAYNALQNSASVFVGSVNEAIQLHPEILDIARRVNASPDKVVRSAGVNILPWTHTSNINSTQFFNDQEVDRFSAALPYDKNKPVMARRDAQSLAFAVRRQGATRSSNAYEAKCIVLTRSSLFVGTAKRFLRDPPHSFPTYAVIPIMELRHFATMFMISFGSEASEKVLRSGLIASCDRVVRISPDLIRRIRVVLAQVQNLPKEQLDAALEDPATLAEFALVTGNDPSVVTAQNSAALLDVIRSAAKKDEELRHLEAEREVKEKHDREMADQRAEVGNRDRLIEELQSNLEDQKRQYNSLEAGVIRQSDVIVDLLAERANSRFRTYWFCVVGLAIALAAGLGADTVWHFTGLSSPVSAIIAACLGMTVFYLAIASFVPSLAPDKLRRFLLHKQANITLKYIADEDVKRAVLEKLGLKK